jgi:hypothetical protein
MLEHRPSAGSAVTAATVSPQNRQLRRRRKGISADVSRLVRLGYRAAAARNPFLAEAYFLAAETACAILAAK